MERLGINSGLLIAQIVNFSVLALLLWLLIWKPLVRALEARREKIAKGLEDAQAAEQKLANAERDAQRLLDERRSEGNKLLEEARARGDDQARLIIEEARREAEAIRAKARQDAGEERTSMLSEVRPQVARIAIAAAERVIGQSLDESKAQAVVADFFAKVPEKAVNLGGKVEVVSAMPLSDAEQASIKTRTGASEIAFAVDPSILGGLVIRAGDKVVDGSVRNSLSTLASTMS